MAQFTHTTTRVIQCTNADDHAKLVAHVEKQQDLTAKGVDSWTSDAQALTVTIIAPEETFELDVA